MRPLPPGVSAGCTGVLEQARTGPSMCAGATLLLNVWTVTALPSDTLHQSCLTASPSPSPVLLTSVCKNRSRGSQLCSCVGTARGMWQCPVPSEPSCAKGLTVPPLPTECLLLGLWASCGKSDELKVPGFEEAQAAWRSMCRHLAGSTGEPSPSHPSLSG